MLPSVACWGARGVPSAPLSTDFPYRRKAAGQVFHLLESKILFSPLLLPSAATDSHRLDVSAFPGPPLEGCHYSLGKLSCTQSGVIDLCPMLGAKYQPSGGFSHANTHSYFAEHTQSFGGSTTRYLRKTLT